MVSKEQAQSIHLKWQWPAGRHPDLKILIRVDTIRKESGGLFGIRKFESMGEHLPDATEVIGTVVLGGDDLRGKTLRLRAPRAELKDVATGHTAGVGIIKSANGSGDICICVRGAPENLGADALKSWLDQMSCS